MKHEIRPPPFFVDRIRLSIQVRRETEELEVGIKSRNMIYNLSGLNTDVCVHNSFALNIGDLSESLLGMSVITSWESDILQICNYMHWRPIGGSKQLNIKGK